MIRRRLGILFVDCLLLIGAIVFAAALRDNLVLGYDRVAGLGVYIAATLGVALVIIPISGIDRGVWRLSAFRDYVRVAWAVTGIVIGAVAICFAINRLDGVSRSIPILQLILSVVALVGVQTLVRSHANARRSRRNAQRVTSLGLAAHANSRSVLIVGLNRLSDLYAEAVAELAPNRVQIAGLVGRSDRHAGRLVGAHRVLGGPEDLEAIVRDLGVHGVFVDSIVVTDRHASLPRRAQEALIRLERASNIKLEFLAEKIGLGDVAMFPEQTITGADAPLEEAMMAELSEDEMRELTNRPYWRLKRLIDFSVALLLLVALAPVIVFVAGLVLFDVGWPIMFWQVRPGWLGRPLKLYKLRTMHDAHAIDGTRLPDDKRVSAVGRFLRRTRLDELPQLINVMVGEMSFVGPRPLLPVDQPKAFAARLLARPGLTGWAQVVGGRSISPQDKAMLDLWYVKHAKLSLDLQILLRTIPMVLFGERTNQQIIERVRSETKRHNHLRRATP
jgi:lipopolysaccharide/colanic/teichoic acid biosynthesis glycosyltransferase